MNGSLVSPQLRARVRGIATPIAIGLGRLGLTPNALTLIGFAGTCLAAIAAAGQAWVLGGLLLLLFGIFDLFDGALARATDRTSALGAFLDSTFDRWGEGIAYVGIAIGCVEAGFGTGAVLAGAALTSAFMVSYTRAKAESLGYASGSGLASIGLAPREVRLAILGIGVIATGVAGGVGSFVVLDCTGTSCAHLFSDGVTSNGATILAITLGLITILATITTIQRILHVRAQAKGG